jgi:hypothetical protein
MDGTRGKPMWVTYRDGVYDVTHFRADHPGAHFIDAAAGGQWTPMSLPPSTPHARLQLSATIPHESQHLLRVRIGKARRSECAKRAGHADPQVQDSRRPNNTLAVRVPL